MSMKDREQGYFDAKVRDTYDPPTKPIIGEIVEGYSKKELERIRDYKEGRNDAKRDK